MKTALLAYNPVSGSRFVSRHLDSIIKKFQEMGVLVTVYRIPEFDENLGKIIKNDYDFVIGAGGDGTLSQVVQEMLESKVNIPFFAIGAGTCNNFTRNIDVSTHINSESEIYQIIDEVYEGKLKKIDVGIVNYKHIFLTSLVGGIFTDTSFSTDKNLKFIMGPLAYYLKPLTELNNIKSYEIEVDVDNNVYKENVYMFLLLNGKSVGNFTNFIDTANISDGVMELVLIKESSTLEIANLFFSIIKGDDITANNNILVLRGNKFKIKSNESMPISIDGEKGPETPLKIDVLKESIEVFVSNSYEK